MKKILIGFFLTLSVLLLSRYAQLYANKYHDCGNNAPTENLERSEHFSADDHKSNGTPIFRFASVNTEKAKFRIDEATEITEEEDEPGSSRKYVKGADCVASIFSAFSDEYYFHRVAGGSPYGGLLSYVTSGRRHLTLRVIRI